MTHTYPTLQINKAVVSEAAVNAGEVALGSRALLAAWVGMHRSQVTRAARGQEIGGEASWRLSSLAAVVTALLSFLDPAAISGWLHGNNAHLVNRRPIDVLAAGDVAAVMTAVQAARAGVFA